MHQLTLKSGLGDLTILEPRSIQGGNGPSVLDSLAPESAGGIRCPDAVSQHRDPKAAPDASLDHLPEGFPALRTSLPGALTLTLTAPRDRPGPGRCTRSALPRRPRRSAATEGRPAPRRPPPTPRARRRRRCRATMPSGILAPDRPVRRRSGPLDPSTFPKLRPDRGHPKAPAARPTPGRVPIWPNLTRRPCPAVPSALLIHAPSTTARRPPPKDHPPAGVPVPVRFCLAASPSRPPRFPKSP